MVWLVYRAVLARCTMTIPAIHRWVYIDWNLNTIVWLEIIRLKIHKSHVPVENQKKLNLMNLVLNEALLILQSTHFRIRLRHCYVMITSSLRHYDVLVIWLLFCSNIRPQCFREISILERFIRKGRVFWFTNYTISYGSWLSLIRKYLSLTNLGSLTAFLT